MMLKGDTWTFIHIPKCGGMTLRKYLEGVEMGYKMPLGVSSCAVRSPLHRITSARPRGRVFSVVRHPAAWLRSYWLDQSPERVGEKRFLHQYWSDDLNEFVANVCKGRSGYVTKLYRAHLKFHSIKVFKLEDGLERVLSWLDIKHDELDVINESPRGHRLSTRSRKMIANSERWTLQQYGYQS